MVDTSTVDEMSLTKKQQDHIIQTATELFGSYGVKTITMDDIASNCGISKKTLYRVFENKYELLQVVVATINIRVSEAIYALRESDNAVEEVFLSLPLTLKIFREVNYRMLLEIEKYHYEIWRKVEVFRQQIILDFIRANLQRGLEEGLFRDDLDLDVMAHMRLQQLNQIHSVSGTNHSDVPHMLQQMTIHYLSGVATNRGRNQISKLSSIH